MKKHLKIITASLFAVSCLVLFVPGSNAYSQPDADANSLLFKHMGPFAEPCIADGKVYAVYMTCVGEGSPCEPQSCPPPPVE